MRVKITADSTCDLPSDIISRYNIGITPLYIIKDEVPYKDQAEITVSDIFEYVESGAGMTRSSAINVSEYQEYFEHWLKECDAIIHISISNHLSVCNQNARLAAESLENVYVIDSYNLSTGSGHIVLDAAIMSESGMAAEQIAKELERLVLKVEASFVIGTLKYLYKGGRCSGLAALGANLLKLNPCIEVISGKMEVGKKYRGRFDKIILQYVEDKLSGRDDIDLKRVFITYPPGMSDGLISEVLKKVRTMKDFDEIISCEAGCVISNHCGPICVGILFYRK